MVPFVPVPPAATSELIGSALSVSLETASPSDQPGQEDTTEKQAKCATGSEGKLAIPVGTSLKVSLVVSQKKKAKVSMLTSRGLEKLGALTHN